ncbi:serine hydrolase [Nonomuraea sp. PA05]|uniref:serine hydrolase n=1 Tax=Nonomuraea sp. PA05 TaxID=2604466 RepID=UPI0016521300|nr:serine hydrolase [Nonomuraea sp. PA05]
MNDDLKDTEAVLAHIRAHPDTIALMTQGIEHNADRLTPVASAIKIIHLAAYTDAVRKGLAKPDEPVSVALWDAYHLPDTDGGAHEAALRRLKPGASVTLDELVSALIEESDNAAADLLRDRFGAQALDEIAQAPVSTINGEALRIYGGCTLPPDVCLRNYVRDGQETRLTSFEYAQEMDLVESVSCIAPRVLHGVLARLKRDEIASRHLEWPMRQPWADPDEYLIGAKMGVMVGLLSEAVYVVRPDGEAREMVLVMRRLTEAALVSGMRSWAPHHFLMRMATDPAFFADVRAALLAR